MAKKKGPDTIDLSKEELEALQDRIKNKQLAEDDYVILEKVLHFSIWITIQLQNAKISINRLKVMIFGHKTEKRSSEKNKNTSPEKDLEKLNADDVNAKEDANNAATPKKNDLNESEKPKKGHGRKPATDYTPDEIIVVSHETLKPGDRCPTDCGGRLYPVPITPGGVIRVQGQSCAHVISYEFQKLRCALCGETFAPKNPEGFQEEKYDERFKAIMVLQKYSLATPFFRQEGYMNIIGFPLADATQWDLVEAVANCAYPVFGALEKIAANYDNANNDDSGVKILDVIKDNKKNPNKERTGMFTTCIIASCDKKPTIVLYYSGVKHSGENMAHFLNKRDKNLSPIVQMCDALSSNQPKAFKTILCNCLAHGRRNFIQVENNFPLECDFVISQIGFVYHYDAQAKLKKMDKEQRLAYHQENSGPVMEALKLWMQQKMDVHEVESTSGLGVAIRYMQRHWEKLTRFLSVAGAHLDNNIVEQALKFAIKVRKNSMFHKSEHGAYVAALFFSIIKTCALSKINPIDYLVELQKNKSAVFKTPDLWLPWNYKTTLSEIEKIPIQEVA